MDPIEKYEFLYLLSYEFIELLIYNVGLSKD